MSYDLHFQDEDDDAVALCQVLSCVFLMEVPSSLDYALFGVPFP